MAGTTEKGKNECNFLRIMKPLVMHTALIMVAYPKQSWAMKGCFQVG